MTLSSIHPTPSELRFIGEAEAFLEDPSFLIRMTNKLGGALEDVQKRIPAKLTEIVSVATEKALRAALELAVKSINLETPPPENSVGFLTPKLTRRLHVASVAATGAVGGFFGLAALPFELPITTTLMLRSISCIAKDLGADLNQVEDRLECLYILTLGSRSDKDDASESIYYGARLGLGNLVRQAAKFITEMPAKHAIHGAEKGLAGPLLNLLSRIAARFEITVTEKALAESVPVIGAVGGAAINAFFMNFFNDAARFHFGLRKLEKKYGEVAVKEHYLECGKKRQKH